MKQRCVTKISLSLYHNLLLSGMSTIQSTVH